MSTQLALVATLRETNDVTLEDNVLSGHWTSIDDGVSALSMLHLFHTHIVSTGSDDPRTTAFLQALLSLESVNKLKVFFESFRRHWRGLESDWHERQSRLLRMQRETDYVWQYEWHTCSGQVVEAPTTLARQQWLVERLLGLAGLLIMPPWEVNAPEMWYAWRQPACRYIYERVSASVERMLQGKDVLEYPFESIDVLETTMTLKDLLTPCAGRFGEEGSDSEDEWVDGGSESEGDEDEWD